MRYIAWPSSATQIYREYSNGLICPSSIATTPITGAKRASFSARGHSKDLNRITIPSFCSRFDHCSIYWGRSSSLVVTARPNLFCCSSSIQVHKSDRFCIPWIGLFSVKHSREYARPRCRKSRSPRLQTVKNGDPPPVRPILPSSVDVLRLSPGARARLHRSPAIPSLAVHHP